MLVQKDDVHACLDLSQLRLYFLDESGVQMVDTQFASKLDTSMATNFFIALQTLVRKSALSVCQPSKLFDLLLQSVT